MDELLGRLEERVGLSRADLLGLAVALLGCVVATMVALRVPLLTHLAVEAPAQAGAVEVEPVGAVQDDGPLVVHVAGAVARPGVVELQAGDRVADALAAAGGTLPQAVLDGLNLARPLVDGEQVLVPTVDDLALGAVGGGAVAGGPPAGLLPDGRVELNTATAEQLEELPGVGPVLAGRIIAHRESNGPFDEAVALREVSGIGEATWASLRDLVGVR